MAIRQSDASTADREIAATRLLDAPRDLVWAAWTDPRHIAAWWGPNGFTNTIRHLDLRPGGEWRFVMHGPDGTDYQNNVVFLEVIEPERLVYDHVTGPKFHVTVTFREAEGKTMVKMRMLFESAVARARAIEEFGAVEGLAQTLARLAAYLPTMDARGAADSGPDGAFVVSRVLDAPRELVWKAWSEPESLMRWWGPRGFTMLVAELDLRPGGTFHYCLEAPADDPMSGRMWGKFVYREVAPPERMMFVVSFSDAQGGITRHPAAPHWPLEVLSTLTLSERDSRTTLTMRGVPVNATNLERETFEAGHSSMQQGWTGTLDQLAEYLRRA